MTHPWIASYGACLKRVNNSGNTYPPCFCALSEKEKKNSQKKGASLEKIKRNR